MKYRGFQSASDRRWQQRYESILQRKENERDFALERKEKKRNQKRKSCHHALHVEDLLESPTAVVCYSKEQVQNLNRCVKNHYKDNVCSYIDADIDLVLLNFNGRVAVIVEQTWFAIEVFLRSPEKCVHYNIVDYYELLPVTDLGNIHANTDELDLLLR